MKISLRSKKTIPQSQSEEKYKILFMSSRDAIVTLEPPSWKFTSANPATLTIFGAKNEKQFLSHEPWKLSPPQQPDGQTSIAKARKMINKAIHEGSVLFEWVHRRLNGDDFFAEVLLSKVRINGRVSLYAVIRDISERKRIEEKLKDYAEERFKAIFDNSNDGIMLADKKTKKFYLVNKTICQMLGYRPDKLIALSIPDIHPPESLPYVLKQFDRQAKGEITIAQNVPVKRKDSSVFYVDINSSRVILEGKEYLLGIFRDITERKKTEEILARSENKYRRLFEAAKDGILILNANTGKITEVNPYLMDLLGYSRKYFLNKKLWQIGLFKDIVSSKAAFEELKAKKYIHYEDLPLKTKFGQIMEVEFVSNVYGLNGESVIQCNIRDISERKKTERMRLEAELQYREFLEKSSDGIVIIKDGRVKFSNLAMKKMTGFKPEEFMDKPIIDFIAPNFKKMVLRNYTQRMAGMPTATRYEFAIVTKNKKILPVETNSSIINFEGGPADMAIIRDISRAKEIDRIKSEFIAVASHQLRSPLTGIKWFSQLLLNEKDAKLTETQRDYLQSIFDSNERMIKLVNDLLDVSHIETGRKFSVDKKKTNIIAVIKRVMADKNIVSRAGKISIEWAPKTPVKLILPIDEKKIEQVFLNLISNSIKYSGAGKKIIINVQKIDGKAYLSVKDFGLGIPKRQQHRIFEKFFRADNIAAISQEGTGLGLYIAKSIIEGHGGKIWFESRENKGTTFYFTLPMK